MLFKGNVFVAVTQWYGVKEKINSEFFVLHKKYARIYDSYKIFTSQAHGGDGSARGPAEFCEVKTVTEVTAAEEIKQNKIFGVVKRPQPDPEPFVDFKDFWNPIVPMN